MLRARVWDTVDKIPAIVSQQCGEKLWRSETNYMLIYAMYIRPHLVSHPRPHQDLDAASPCFIGKGRHFLQALPSCNEIYSIFNDIHSK